jgi:hypothetical protein
MIRGEIVVIKKVLSRQCIALHVFETPKEGPERYLDLAVCESCQVNC